MAAVLDRLADAPKTGLPYRTLRNRQIRRLLMARTSYSVYFEIQEERAHPEAVGYRMSGAINLGVSEKVSSGGVI